MDKDKPAHPKSAPHLPLVKPMKWKETPLTQPDPKGEFLLPTGIVTLMLGDIEGSTRLWEDEPQIMLEAIARLNRMVTESIRGHNGVRPLEQGEGDSFVAAFARPTDAVASALDIQRKLLDSPVKLRIGIHTGEVHLRGPDNYAGSNVNRAARLRDAGHGGQVIVSASTRDLVLDDPPEHAGFLDLGTHHLKDLSRPEHVFQLVHPDLPNEFPSLRSLGTFRTNLPVQLTTFVGRSHEMAEVKQLLGDARLVTLIGAGGAGKTRLALQVAAELLEAHPGGTWFVDLSSITEGEDIAAIVATSMGVPEHPLAGPAQRIAEQIDERKTLLVLDNCEHVLSGCAALVIELLHSASGARILATSREPLRVEGEVVWRVPSLQIPSATESGRIEGLAECEAVQLFVERAKRARHNFELTDQNAEAVGQICERLDGVPLAIELAAAQVRALTAAQIERALNDRFRLLTGGARTVVPRQQTLRASVDWGHDLLPEKERILLRRLSVFSGGFRLDDAEAVCAGEGIDPYEILELLIGLVDRSLVIMDDTGDEPRYGMLETIRSYASERLSEAKEQDAVALRHRNRFLDLLVQTSPSRSPQLEQVLTLADREYTNFIAALEWSRSQDDVEQMSKMAHLLTPYWQMHGPRAPGRDWISLALTKRESLEPEMVTNLLSDAVRLGVNPSEDVSFGEEAVALAREIGDAKLLSKALSALGSAKAFIAGGQHGIVHLEESLDLARASQSPESIAGALQLLATYELWLTRVDQSRQHAAEALAVAEGAGDDNLAAASLFLLAQCETIRGDIGKAIEHLKQGLKSVDPMNLARRSMLLSALASLVMHRGEFDEARRLTKEAHGLLRQLEQGSDRELDHALARISVAEGVPKEDELEIIRNPPQESGWDAIGTALDVGDLELAKRLLRPMQTRVAQTEHPIALVVLKAFEAQAALMGGRYREAEEFAHSALTIVRNGELAIYLPSILELLAAAAAEEQSPHEAARLIGGAEAAADSMGIVRFHSSDERRAKTLAKLRELIGDEALAQAVEQGSKMNFTELIAYAQRGRGDRKRPSHGWESLTPTEVEVAACVAEGLSNADIGVKLFISTGTVRAHLSHIFIKLGMNSRTQLAAEATRRTGTTKPSLPLEQGTRRA